MTHAQQVEVNALGFLVSDEAGFGIGRSSMSMAGHGALDHTVQAGVAPRALGRLRSISEDLAGPLDRVPNDIEKPPRRNAR
jgi:hypothetical protein